MDKIKNYNLKILKKTSEVMIDPGQIVKEMKKVFQLTEQYIPDVKDVAKFFAHLLDIGKPEIVKITNLTFIASFIVNYDDQIEKGEQYGTQLLQLIDGEVEATEINCEVIYAKLIKGIVESMDDHFKNFLLNAIKKQIQNQIEEHHLDYNKLSMEQYMSSRSASNNIDIYRFFFEYGLDIILKPELRESQLMRELLRDTQHFLNVIQDTYSYKNEAITGYPGGNYLILKMDKLKIGLDECVDQIIAELDETETKIAENLNKLLFSKPGITELYLKGFSNLLVVLVMSYKSMKRYNS